MLEELASRCASLHAELEALFEQPVWDRPRIAQLRRQLDAAQRRQAMLIRSQAHEQWRGEVMLRANYRCGTADQRV